MISAKVELISMECAIEEVIRDIGGCCTESAIAIAEINGIEVQLVATRDDQLGDVRKGVVVVEDSDNV